MKTLKQKEGWLNRHTEGLPEDGTIIKILYNFKGIEHEKIYLCQFEAVNPKLPHEKGFLGTARIIARTSTSIGLHIWEHNDYEFIYYQPVNMEK